MVKRFIIAGLAVVVVSGGLIGFNIFRDNAISQYFATMKPPPVTVSAVAVAPRAWKPGITAFGTVYAAQGVDVASEVAGIVKAISFAANDKVSAGQLLVQIDDAVERADLLAAETALKVNQQALDRATTLSSKGVNSAVTVDTAQAELDSSRSQLARLDATLDQKAIRAPFAGTVGIPRVDVGQYVQPGTVIATLQDLDTMKVDFTVPEGNLAQIKIGQPASFGLSEDHMMFTGMITGIDPKIDPGSRLVAVQARLSKPDQELRPGQFIRVRVELPEENNVIVLPQTAVVSSLYGDYVYVVEKQAPSANTPPSNGGAVAAAAPEDVARQVFVKTGRRTGDTIEIVEGIKPGEQVVTSGQNKVSNGTLLTIDNSVDVTKSDNLVQPGS